MSDWYSTPEERIYATTYYVMIDGERVIVPKSLSFGLVTGYIDLDYCLGGISEEEAQLFYGMDVKTLKKLIQISQKDGMEVLKTDFCRSFDKKFEKILGKCCGK